MIHAHTMNCDETSLSQTDFYGWTQQQEQALAHRPVSSLDWEHLREEVDSWGRQEYREWVSRLIVLLGHLLQWEYQPQKRSRIWFLTIQEQWRAIRRHLRQNPSLKSQIPQALADGSESGVDLALRETDLPLRSFPPDCPYDFEQVMMDYFLCDTTQDGESVEQ
jgi:hypothetical protein